MTRFHVRCATLCCIALLLLGLPACQQAQEIASEATTELEASEMERGIDRPGSDYRNFDVDGAGPEACMKACREDERCRAWTWTEPGYQSPGGMCWLKNDVPDKEPLEEAVSGVVRPK